MQFSVILLSSFSFGAAIAQVKGNIKTASTPASTGSPNAPKASGVSNPGGQVKVHVVRVGAGGATKFEPNKLAAQVGDMVQFQFAGGNHTVAQSTFDQPCVPISMVNPKVAGFYSGYMPISAATEMMPTYTIMIENQTPVWIYCAQGQHCQKGMQMVINENVQANASRTLENFSALAAKAVTVQMKADGNPDASTPSRPSGAIPKPSGAPPKTGDKGSSPDSNDKTLPDESSKFSPSPISSSSRISANIVVCALTGTLAFALIM